MFLVHQGLGASHLGAGEGGKGEAIAVGGGETSHVAVAGCVARHPALFEEFNRDPGTVDQAPAVDVFHHPFLAHQGGGRVDGGMNASAAHEDQEGETGQTETKEVSHQTIGWK